MRLILQRNIQNTGKVRDGAIKLQTRDRRPPRNIDFTIGGGPTVHLKTNNGGVPIQKI